MGFFFLYMYTVQQRSAARKGADGEGKGGVNTNIILAKKTSINQDTTWSLEPEFKSHHCFFSVSTQVGY